MESGTVQNLLWNWADQAIEGKNPFDSISEEKIEEMYGVAYALYQNKNYQNASYFFRLLTVSRPGNPKFWKGLGATLQMEKNYEEALNCYLCCSSLNDSIAPDPLVYTSAADCYFALNQVNEGLQALKEAENSAKRTSNKTILRHVYLMRSQWSTHS